MTRNLSLIQVPRSIRLRLLALRILHRLHAI